MHTQGIALRRISDEQARSVHAGIRWLRSRRAGRDHDRVCSSPGDDERTHADRRQPHSSEHRGIARAPRRISVRRARPSPTVCPTTSIGAPRTNARAPRRIAVAQRSDVRPGSHRPSPRGAPLSARPRRISPTRIPISTRPCIPDSGLGGPHPVRGLDRRGARDPSPLRRAVRVRKPGPAPGGDRPVHRHRRSSGARRLRRRSGTPAAARSEPGPRKPGTRAGRLVQARRDGARTARPLGT